MVHSVDEISNTLLRHRLVSDNELMRARSDLRTESADEFLSLLIRRQILTDFQVDRIRAGETGILVIGGNKLLYRNASGSFARLYRGASLKDGSVVGIKLLRERWAKDKEFVALFHREGDLGQRLKHPNIVPIYESGTDREYHYLAMEFVEGGNLRDFLKIRGKLAPEEACRFALDIARGLEYALKFGIAHRDLKSTNVLMSSTGVAKLIDFGLAADESLLNRAGTDLQQALEYSTLEKGSGAPPNDPRSDLFFLGTILYEMVAGQEPYPRTRDREERKRFSRYRDIRPVTSVDRNLPMSVAGIVDQLLQTSPQHRFQTPTEVVAALEDALRSLGVETSGGPKAEASGTPKPSSVLIVENRPKQQDMLRDYLTNRGYRVLMVSDPDRALARLKTQPPDCLVLVGEVIGDRIVDDFRKASDASIRNRPAVIAVLSEKQVDRKGEVESSANGRTGVLVQPITLRDLRQLIQKTLESRT